MLMKYSIDIKMLDQLLESIRSGPHIFFRVPLEIVGESSAVFDAFYDVAERRVGGPVLASDGRDIKSQRRYLYFWPKGLRVSMQIRLPGEASRP